MKYVMSDIHGGYRQFIEMLKLINFKETDILYILGDIFDRQDDTLKILDYIVGAGRNNIILLKGNHEKLFQDAHETHQYGLWYANGGYKTHEQMIYSGSEKENQIYEYIKKLPLIKLVDKFILVHAGIKIPCKIDTIEELLELNNKDEEFCLWSRDNIGHEKKFKDYTVICGHTPVQYIENGQNHILKKYGTIYIDCGCFSSNGKLSCLRLDDMAEFYI